MILKTQLSSQILKAVNMNLFIPTYQATLRINGMEWSTE